MYEEDQASVNLHGMVDPQKIVLLSEWTKPSSSVDDSIVSLAPLQLPVDYVLSVL